MLSPPSSESSSASSDLAPAIAPPLGFCVDDFFEKFGYTEGSVIGRGMSGQIVLAVPKSGPVEFRAVKKLPLYGDRALDQEQRKLDRKHKRLFANEVEILKQLTHPHLMLLLMTVSCPRYLGIVMPYCSKGSLYNYISQLDARTARKYFMHVTSAVYHLHQLKIVHGDIKPSNILIDRQDRAILCDFGLSRQMPDYDTEVVVTGGTKFYRAPETMTKEQKAVNPFKCDMYALGATLWSMLLKRKPNDWTNYLVDLRRFNFMYLIPDTAMDRAEGLLEKDPDERWSIQTLMDTFKGIPEDHKNSLAL